MTDVLRALHARAHQLLTAAATVAVELAPADHDLRRAWAEADGLLSRLVAQGLEDRAARAYPGGAGADGPVSSSAVSDPTGAAGLRDLKVVPGEPRRRPPDARTPAELVATMSDPDATRFEQHLRAFDYLTVTRSVQHVVGILEHAPTDVPTAELARASVRQGLTKTIGHVATVLRRCEQRLTPRATGEPCPTVARDDDGTIVARCEGRVTHHSTGRGLCEQCDGDWRSQRHLDIPPDVIEARNARRRHPCTCHDTACDHDPGGCYGLLDPGVLAGRCEHCACACGPECCPDGCTDPRRPGRRLSERCKKRQDRRSTVGTGGAFAWNPQPGR